MSTFFNPASKGSLEVTSNILHLLNSGSCPRLPLSDGIRALPPVATVAANLANTSLPKNSPNTPTPLAKPGNTIGSFEAKYVAGLIATVFAIFKAPPPKNNAGFNKASLPITPKAGPTNGKTPPIIAPSAANRNLFLKLAATLSLPLISLVSSYLPTSFEDNNGSSNISAIVL